MQNRIYIVGMPASGKSTFGKELAYSLNWNYIDLDEQIEKETGKNIDEIWNSTGEVNFRTLEKNALNRTSKLTNTVISCGGGTAEYEDNMDQITKWGLSIYLNINKVEITNRIANSRGNRPMFTGKSPVEIHETVQNLVEKRGVYYSKAKIVWNSNEVNNMLKSTVNQLLNM